MKVTSVTGHIMNYEFDPKFKGWFSVPPEKLITGFFQLFPIVIFK